MIKLHTKSRKVIPALVPAAFLAHIEEPIRKVEVVAPLETGWQKFMRIFYSM